MDSSDSRNHHGRRHSSHRHDHQRQRDARSRSPNEPSTHSRTQGHAAMDRSHRERSPHTHHRKRKHSSHTKPEGEEIVLPDNARKLVKSDLASFRPLLGLYLDIQKGKDIEDMEEDEVKGRWKSFLGKWNRGELASGYYDPETLRKAVAESGSGDQRSCENMRERDSDDRRESDRDERGRESGSDEEIGPALPPSKESRARRRGPTIPNMQDLEMRKEMELEDRQSQIEDIRYARKADRNQQKALLEELLPRPDAGRDRQLEKKKLLNEKMKGFREKSPDGAELPESELMGDDGIDGFKKRKKEEERKKTEREIRKEEFLRARAEEREERLRGYREKEEGTVEMLRALARRNFG